MLVRNSTKGFIYARVVHQEVWLWDGKEQQAHQWHLVVSDSDLSKNRRKYSLSNAPSDTPISRLVCMQGQCYWVERAIEDGKSHAGLADYQFRTWTGWHHHMALVMLALLFVLETKIKNEHSHQLLSCYDIQILLSHFYQDETSPNKKSSGKCSSDINNGLRRLNSTVGYKFKSD